MLRFFDVHRIIDRFWRNANRKCFERFLFNLLIRNAMNVKSILFLVLLSMPSYLFSCPAKKVELSYSRDTKLLSIVIDHPVTNAKGHYIDNIKIMVNGKEFKTIKPTKQFSLTKEKQEIEIGDLAIGAKVEVKTHCNQSGNKSGKLIVK